MTPHLVQVESNPDFELAPCFPYLLSLFKSMVMVNEWHFIKLCFFSLTLFTNSEAKAPDAAKTQHRFRPAASQYPGTPWPWPCRAA